MWILLADTNTKRPWIVCEDYTECNECEILLFKDLDAACEMQQKIADEGISSSFKAVELGI